MKLEKNGTYHQITHFLLFLTPHKIRETNAHRELHAERQSSIPHEVC